MCAYVYVSLSKVLFLWGVANSTMHYNHVQRLNLLAFVSSSRQVLFTHLFQEKPCRASNALRQTQN